MFGAKKKEDPSVHNDPLNPSSRYGGWGWRDDRRDNEHFRRCDFCGSIHPEDLVAERDWVAQWSDRKYGWPHKFYIDIPNREPETLYVIGSSSSRHSDEPRYKNWKNVDSLTPEEMAVLNREYSDDSPYRPSGSVLLGTRSNHFGKFYSVHLSDSGISDEVKEEIMRISGIRFEFFTNDAGSQRVRSVPYTPKTE